MLDLLAANSTMSDSVSIVWRSHPARERPGAAAAVCLVTGALAGLAAELMGHIGWGAFAALVMAVALHRFFLPTEYRIDEDGVGARSLLSRCRLRWEEIRRFAHDERGGLISPRARPTLLPGARDIPLQFSGNRDNVVAAVRAGMARHRAAAETASCAG